jgi:translation initiation factor eIF-2B subunit delta
MSGWVKMEHWRKSVEQIRLDTVSGAAEVAKSAVEALHRWLDRSLGLSPQDWRQELFAFGRALVAAQPSMAPLFNLINEVCLAVESAATFDDAQQQARRAAQMFQRRLARAPDLLVRAALPLFSANCRVLTLSYSSTVLEVLRAAHAGGLPLTVFCTESRPGLEGRRLAQRLADAGIAVRFGVDAALSTFARQASLALVGADSITPLGVVNKVGTTALAQAAGEARIPCFALCGRQKFFPAAAPLPDVQPPRPPEEVWPDPPMGVHVWNAYFECTPFALFSGVIVETGVLTPEALVQELGGMPVAEALREPPR